MGTEMTARELAQQLYELANDWGWDEDDLESSIPWNEVYDKTWWVERAERLAKELGVTL